MKRRRLAALSEHMESRLVLSPLLGGAAGSADDHAESPDAADSDESTGDGEQSNETRASRRVSGNQTAPRVGRARTTPSATPGSNGHNSASTGDGDSNPDVPSRSGGGSSSNSTTPDGTSSSSGTRAAANRFKVTPHGGPTDGGPTDGGPSDGGPTDGGPTDGGPTDGGPTDGGPTDGGPTDGGPTDGGPTDGGPTDGGPTDGGPTDGGPTNGGPTDGGPTDGGPTDGGPSDGGPSDGGPTDGGPTDGGPTAGGPSDGGPSDSGPTDGGSSDKGDSKSDRPGDSDSNTDEPSGTTVEPMDGSVGDGDGAGNQDSPDGSQDDTHRPVNETPEDVRPVSQRPNSPPPPPPPGDGESNSNETGQTTGPDASAQQGTGNETRSDSVHAGSGNGRDGSTVLETNDRKSGIAGNDSSSATFHARRSDSLSAAAVTAARVSVSDDALRIVSLQTLDRRTIDEVNDDRALYESINRLLAEFVGSQLYETEFGYTDDVAEDPPADSEQREDAADVAAGSGVTSSTVDGDGSRASNRPAKHVKPVSRIPAPRPEPKFIDKAVGVTVPVPVRPYDWHLVAATASGDLHFPLPAFVAESDLRLTLDSEFDTADEDMNASYTFFGDVTQMGVMLAAINHTGHRSGSFLEFSLLDEDLRSDPVLSAKERRRRRVFGGRGSSKPVNRIRDSFHPVETIDERHTIPCADDSLDSVFAESAAVCVLFQETDEENTEAGKDSIFAGLLLSAVAAAANKANRGRKKRPATRPQAPVPRYTGATVVFEDSKAS